MLLAGILLPTLVLQAAAEGAITGKWVLVEIDGKPVAAERAPYFAVTGNQVEGFDGCNRFGGPLQPAGQFFSTRMACVGDAVRLPIDLNGFADRLGQAKMNDRQLVLPAIEGWPAAVFAPG